MIKIGITGGIGSGKSYIADLIKKQGLPVFNCDDAAKYIMANDDEIKAKLKELIGEEIYTDGGNLNKQMMSDFIYLNEDNRKKINEIVHPAVREQYMRWLSVQYTSVVFMESAILFESGFSDLVDKVIHVFASDEVRLHRLIKRDGLTRMQAYERMQAQMSEAVKMKFADYCILNNGNMDVAKQLGHILDQLMPS
ncbi:MAG: dephospho-CoA kinase [Bacteroidaceae bacterium]|nr:dephospho-CoA kinase [Bacteroidaceae bacterium]